MFHTCFTSFTCWVALISFIACFCNMTQWFFFTAVSLANLWSLVFVCVWAPAPLPVWFAVFLAKRKSGRGICGSSCCVLCLVLFVMIWRTCDQLCPCNNIFEYCLYSCKDRASERHQPYQRKKNPKPSGPNKAARNSTPKIEEVPEEADGDENSGRMDESFKRNRDVFED